MKLNHSGQRLENSHRVDSVSFEMLHSVPHLEEWHMHRLHVMGAFLVVLGHLSPYCVAQIPIGSKIETGPAKRQLVVSGNSSDDVRRLLDGRESLIDWCLETLARREPTTYQERAQKSDALRLLGQLYAGDRRDAVRVLVRNLPFHFPTPKNDSPLLGFKAAQSLAQIGSPAMPSLLEHLRNELGSGELRLVAFVIHEVDGRLLGRARIEIEMERLAAAPEGAPSAEAYARNLERLRGWFSEEQFFVDPKNYPAAGEF